MDRRDPAVASPNLAGDVAVDFDAGGQAYRARGIVEGNDTTISGQTTLLIRGSGALDPEP